ncbi:MAG: hypothetical protein JXC32_06070, partial [Anaerolineae bacterium]|nr:hypothetical protein [Anaerolineae bacterium]
MVMVNSRLRIPSAPLVLGAVAIGLGLFISRAPLPVIVLALGGPALIAVSLMEPLVAVGAALLLGPLRAWLEIAMPGIAPHVGQGVLLLAFGSWLASGMLRRRVVFPVPTVFWPLVAFLAMGLVSLWQPVDVWAGALEFLKWAQVL